jgi:Protein-L-isoaspartate(D-aspartate) O-methyltransferase (PCMT)
MQGKSIKRNLKLSSILMAWRSHGKNNAELIDQLHENGVIASQEIMTVMKKTDRKFYCEYGTLYTLLLSLKFTLNT